MRIRTTKSFVALAVAGLLAGGAAWSWKSWPRRTTGSPLESVEFASNGPPRPANLSGESRENSSPPDNPANEAADAELDSLNSVPPHLRPVAEQILRDEAIKAWKDAIEFGKGDPLARQEFRKQYQRGNLYVKDGPVVYPLPEEPFTSDDAQVLEQYQLALSDDNAKATPAIEQLGLWTDKPDALRALIALLGVRIEDSSRREFRWMLITMALQRQILQHHEPGEQAERALRNLSKTRQLVYRNRESRLSQASDYKAHAVWLVDIIDGKRAEDAVRGELDRLSGEEALSWLVNEAWVKPKDSPEKQGERAQLAADIKRDGSLAARLRSAIYWEAERLAKLRASAARTGLEKYGVRSVPLIQERVLPVKHEDPMHYLLKSFVTRLYQQAPDESCVDVLVAMNSWHDIIKIGARSAVPGLIQRVEQMGVYSRKEDGSISPQLREGIAFYLGVLAELGGDDVRELLRKILLDGEYHLSNDAAWALGRMGEAGADVLLEGIKNDQASVRLVSALALKRTNDPRAIAALTAFLQDPPNGIKEGQINDMRRYLEKNGK